MVTALGAEMDVVLGLEAGASDDVAKPYHLRELVARIQAVWRRVSPPPPMLRPLTASSPARLDTVVAGPLEVDFSSREVFAGRRRVHLSRRYLVTMGGLGFRFDRDGTAELVAP